MVTPIRRYKNYWSRIPLEKQCWRRRLQGKKSLNIEVGAGAGLHAMQFSKESPGDLLIPIERTKVKFTSLKSRYQGHGCPDNLYPVYDDATKWISQNISPGEVDSYYFLYPNPYPKSSQSNKRFHNMPFMHYLIETLKKHGKLTLATNEAFYYQEFKNNMVNYFGLTIYSDFIVPKEACARTHFEKKYLERGEQCFNLVLMKC